VPVNSAAPLFPDASERLLADMLAHGETLAEEIQIPRALLDEMKQSADLELARRLNERKAELLRVNGALIRNRLVSLTASYEAKRKKHEEMICKEESGQVREHYLRLLRGGLRNIEADYEQGRLKLAEAEKVDVRFVSFAAGAVRVNKPSA
jgi:hypothetical protein